MCSKINKTILNFIVILYPFLLPAQDLPGFLSVTSPKGMSVYVDTTFVGNEGIRSYKLAEGEYTVHVYDPGSLNWSDRGMVKNIQIRSGILTTVSFDNSDQMEIETIPFGGKVFLKDELIGITPLQIDREIVSSHAISIHKEGFVPKKFTVGELQQAYHPIVLEPSKPSLQVESVILSDNDSQLKWYREGLVVTSLLSSWASYFLKREADQTYQRYQRASDSREMIALYSQTKHYDTLSEIAIVVSATTLATYFYMLVTD